MTFFYDLNQRLAGIAQKQQLAESAQLDEKYMGFSKLEKDIAQRGDVRDPAAVAASIGRKKYGKEKFQRAAAAGKKLGEEDLQEKWDEPTKVAPSEKGKYKGKTKAELKKQYDRLKASGPHKKGSPEFGRMRELAFAIRAKSDWGKVDEAPNEGNEFSGALAKARASGAKEFEVDGKTYDVKEAAAWPGSKEYKRQHGTDIEAFRLRHAPSVMKDPEARKELSKMDTEHELLKKMRRGEIDPDDVDTGMPAGEKRGRGRPKGSKRAIGAKGPTGRSKLLTREQNVAEATGNLASIVRANQRDVDAFMRSGDLSDSLYNVLFDYYMDEMPYGTAKARTGDPYEWISDRFHDDMGGGIKEDYDKDEYDEEGEMAKSQSRTIEDAARELQAMLGDNENMPEWVQKKINLAKEYIDSARDYLKANRPEQDMDESALQAYLGKKKYGEQGMKALQKAGRDGASKEKMARIRAQHDKLDEVDLEEKAVSKAQRAAAGIAYAAKKGDIPKSELRGASKEMAKMPAKELKKFAKTKEKGLPEKKDEAVEETTTSGSVATAPAANEKKSKGGMQFGKGIYDSMNREVEAMIAESMSINMSDSTEGGKSLTVTASDDDAMKLAAILKMAGLDAVRSEAETDTGCGTMEEAYGDTDVTKNQPDYPTNTETSDDALQYAGGLNKPKLQVNPNNKADNPLAMKSLGQTAHSLNLGDDDSELRRIREMAGIREAAKPDFLDIDKDGDRREPMKQAAQQVKKLDELSPELLKRAGDAASKKYSDVYFATKRADIAAHDKKMGRTPTAAMTQSYSQLPTVDSDLPVDYEERYYNDPKYRAAMIQHSKGFGGTPRSDLSPAARAIRNQIEKFERGAARAASRDSERQAAAKQAAQAAGTSTLSPAMQRKLAAQPQSQQLAELSPELLDRAADKARDEREKFAAAAGSPQAFSQRRATDPAFQAAWQGVVDRPDKFVKAYDKAVTRDQLKGAGHLLSPAMQRKIKQQAGMAEAAKPDFPDIDDDGDTKEPIAKAARDKEEKVDEAVKSSLWDLYKRIA